MPKPPFQALPWRAKLASIFSLTIHAPSGPVRAPSAGYYSFAALSVSPVTAQLRNYPNYGVFENWATSQPVNPYLLVSASRSRSKQPLLDRQTARVGQ